MRPQRNIPAVPGIAIAFSAAALGMAIGNGTLRGVAGRHAQTSDNAVALILILEVLFLALVVVALVIIKSLADRGYQRDSDLLEAFLEHIPDNVFFKDRDSRFVRISRAMALYCGLADAGQAVDKTDLDIFSWEHAEKALADEAHIVHTGEAIIEVEEKESWPDGRESWVLTTKVPLTDRRGEIIGTMGISHNITERKKTEAKISFMALHDALTGLPNRILLEDRLAQAIALARRNQKRVAVLILDLDHFKNINDTFGHATGDHLLVATSRRLKSCLRDSDIVARLGGDEFVLGVPVDCDDDGGERIAQKILNAFVDPFHIEGRELRVNASIGICTYPEAGEDPETLIQSADAAMYEAKKKRRGTCCLFSHELIDTVRNRQVIENDLCGACGRGEFLLHYQPLVSTESGRITGVEALLRWFHPLRGLIAPGDFIPQLEDLGLMEEVGQWVLRTACLQNMKWQQEGLPPIRVAVNISAQQFYWGDIRKTVKQVLHETQLDPQWLELELTESLTLDASENTVQIMGELKKIGVTLSLDDFGTGWSSLSYLSRFPLDRLKIDRSFMRDITSQPASQAIVESIITLGRSLGLTCVGEGVETNQQLDFLRGLMCPEVQGYLYSPPLPESECTALLRFEGLTFTDTPTTLNKQLYKAVRNECSV